MNESAKREIPASACTLIVGEFAIGDNGQGAKSAPVRLVARSGKAIDHWFWGRIVHDLAGMHMHKSRVPIDYCHDSKEIIGYLNRFETADGDLVTSGALTPWKDSDRATEIIHKAAQGVPYEASINFGGDGIKIQELREGETAEVNGASFDGPGVIVREWPLRGVAICPYGADANTSSDLMAGHNARNYAATVLSAEPEAEKEETQMIATVETPAQVETPEAVIDQTDELNQEPETVETEPEGEADKGEASELEAVDPYPAVEPEPVEEEPEPKPADLSRDEFLRIVDRFGADVAAATVKDGGDYASAMQLHLEALEAENAALRAQVAESSAGKAGQPVPVRQDTSKPPLFKNVK
jgi:hypothetical protein